MYKLRPKDRIELAGEVASRVLDELPNVLAGMQERAPGIRVIAEEEAAALLGKSARQLSRMKDGPTRRKISSGRIGYFEHEVEGTPACYVLVQDSRRIDVAGLTEKLGLHRRTISRMVGRGELPAPDSKHTWYERDIDDWLLRRPHQV